MNGWRRKCLPPSGAKKTATRAAIEVSEVVSLDELDFEGA
jgi:hypothetical protein